MSIQKEIDDIKQLYHSSSLNKPQTAATVDENQKNFYLTSPPEFISPSNIHNRAVSHQILHRPKKIVEIKSPSVEVYKANESKYLETIRNLR